MEKVKTHAPKTAFITQEDQQKLYSLCPESDKPIIAFLMLHGQRPGEARALRVQDVNIFNRSITISSTWSSNELRPFRKGEDAPAITIPIHPECLPYVTDRVKSATPAAWLFINPRSGGHYTDSALDRVWKGILKRAGITGLRKYDAFRHSFATNLILQDTPLKKVQRLLGHTSSATTERYTHIDVEGARADLEKLSLKKVVKMKRKAIANKP